MHFVKKITYHSYELINILLAYLNIRSIRSSCLIANGYLVSVVGGATLGHVLNAGPALPGGQVGWHHEFTAKLELLDVGADAGELGHLCTEGSHITFGVEVDLVDVVEELDFNLVDRHDVFGMVLSVN